MRLTFWLLIIVCHCYVHSLNGLIEAVVLSIDKTTYKNYTGECAQRPDIEEPEILGTITGQMVSQSIREVWLPIKKKDFGHWEWLTGEFYKPFITSPEWSQPGLDCGLLRSETQLIDDVPCINNRNYYACQAEEQCIPNRPKHPTCVEHNNSSYYIYKETSNWYDARDHCTKINQTLAVFTKAERGVILDKISKAMVQDSHMWIGLRQKDYYLELSYNEKRLLREHHWNRKELCQCPEKNCVLLVHSLAGDFSWVPEHCDSRRAFFCMQEVTTANFIPAMNITRAPSTILGQDNSWPWWFKQYYWLIIIGAGCVGGGLLLIIITGICWCYIRKRCTENREKEPHQEVVPLKITTDSDVGDSGQRQTENGSGVAYDKGENEQLGLTREEVPKENSAVKTT